MHPTTIIDLILLLGIIIAIGCLALELPKKVRKIVWVLSGVILLLGITFYVVRPFIVQYQTNKATEELMHHLEGVYPEDSWVITDTDEHEIHPVIYLHVRFESETKMLYEYAVQNKTIDQVDMWMSSGHSIEESEVDPQHEE
ncbi:hypothetical protein MHI18_15190 [Peribacillus sp. FSL H8-0477]|uniref:hypothetical protein n=1 Tax=Peribacillus sp. FSL H8-0477 TaxID=2921388 RepID=UPI0030F72851